MTREEAKELLGENATEEQITALLNQFHEEHGSLKNQIKNLEKEVENTKKSNTELLEYKNKVEELEKAKLSEQERIKLDKEEAARKNREATELLNSVKAKSILVDAGIDEKEASDLVSTFVKEDEVATLESATLIANQLKTVRENTIKQTREELANIDLMPAPSNIPPNSKMTWEKFCELSPEEQNKFANENPEEFQNL